LTKLTGDASVKKKKSNKLIEWFVEEGTLKQEGNLYIAGKAFRANSVINWIKKGSLDKTLSKKEIEENMLIVRMFLQDKIDLEWENGMINVFTLPLSEEKDFCAEEPAEGNV